MKLLPARMGIIGGAVLGLMLTHGSSATLAAAAQPALAPQAASALPGAAQISQLIKEVADEQVEYLQHTGPHFRYHLHRIDPKENTLRDIIESTDGNLSRLLQHNDRALTPEEDSGDRERLSGYLQSGDLRRKDRDEKRNHGFGVELIHAMPTAMLYTLSPGQPQLPGQNRHQIVLDFVPNPEFKATTTAEGLLSGIAGRLWIDGADHHLLRIELKITRNLDLALGLLARVYAGGTVEYEQQRIEGGVYAFSHLRMHLRLRELMVKTVPYDSDLTATDVEQLTPPPTPETAVQVLLNDAVKTR